MEEISLKNEKYENKKNKYDSRFKQLDTVLSRSAVAERQNNSEELKKEIKNSRNRN